MQAVFDCLPKECPICKQLGHDGVLQSFQLSLEDCIELCSRPGCTYPMGHQPISEALSKKCYSQKSPGSSCNSLAVSPELPSPAGSSISSSGSIAELKSLLQGLTYSPAQKKNFVLSPPTPLLSATTSPAYTPSPPVPNTDVRLPPVSGSASAKTDAYLSKVVSQAVSEATLPAKTHILANHLTNYDNFESLPDNHDVDSFLDDILNGVDLAAIDNELVKGISKADIPPTTVAGMNEDENKTSTLQCDLCSKHDNVRQGTAFNHSAPWLDALLNLLSDSSKLSKALHLSANSSSQETMQSIERLFSDILLELSFLGEADVQSFPGALISILKRNDALQSLSSVACNWRFSCKACGLDRVVNQQNPVVIVPELTQKFSMQNPTFTRPCIQCGAPDKAVHLNFSRLSDLVLIHTSLGLKDLKQLSHMNFTWSEESYRLLGFMSKHCASGEGFSTWKVCQKCCRWRDVVESGNVYLHQPETNAADVRLLAFERCVQAETKADAAKIAVTCTLGPESERLKANVSATDVKTRTGVVGHGFSPPAGHLPTSSLPQSPEASSSYLPPLTKGAPPPPKVAPQTRAFASAAATRVYADAQGRQKQGSSKSTVKSSPVSFELNQTTDLLAEFFNVSPHSSPVKQTGRNAAEWEDQGQLLGTNLTAAARNVVTITPVTTDTDWQNQARSNQSALPVAASGVQPELLATTVPTLNVPHASQFTQPSLPASLPLAKSQNPIRPSVPRYMPSQTVLPVHGLRLPGRTRPLLRRVTPLEAIKRRLVPSPPYPLAATAFRGHSGVLARSSSLPTFVASPGLQRPNSPRLQASIASSGLGPTTAASSSMNSVITNSGLPPGFFNKLDKRSLLAMAAKPARATQAFEGYVPKKSSSATNDNNSSATSSKKRSSPKPGSSSSSSASKQASRKSVSFSEEVSESEESTRASSPSTTRALAALSKSPSRSALKRPGPFTDSELQACKLSAEDAIAALERSPVRAKAKKRQKALEDKPVKGQKITFT